jgi:carbon-monoxide dehydrogenase large subunit
VTADAGPYTGRPLRRREDERLLRGQGRFVADLAPASVLQAHVLRSPHAHARILHIDASRALALPGVAAVLTAAELGAANRPLPNRFPHAAMRYYPQYPLAREKVHYVGEPVALIVADSRYLAEDAADLIEVSYEPLPPVVDMEAALRPGAPAVHDDQGASDNLAGRFTQHYGDVDAAFAAAHVVVEERLVLRKCAGVPIECRGITASLDDLGRLVVWDATQTPHMIRDLLAGMLDRGSHEIRVIPPDVGGGFGVKEPFYPEELLIPYLAQSLRRPVQWIEDRRENLLASIQERGQVHTAAMALDRDGRILGIRDRFVADSGSFCAWGIVVPVITSTMIPGAYHVPAYRCEVEVAYTNTCPLAPYRGAGRPQATFVMERLLDQAARVLGLDRAEIRFRNLVQSHEFPYAVGLNGRDGSPLVYDSGDYPACLSKALALVGAERFAAEQAAAREAGRRLGLGMAVAVENTGLGPHEGARIRVEPGPRVVVYTGACSQGQGHLTAFSQLAADVLRVHPEQVVLVGGDTDGIAYGSGTFASRSAVNAGSAVVAAAERVKAQALRLGAQALEASVDDLELREGAVRLKGVPERMVSLSDLAVMATAPFPGQSVPAGFAVGLEATEYFMPTAPTYASSAHVAVVEVDPLTGRVFVLRYAIVHDCGNVINPLIVHGQVVGGFAAGLGNALYEEVVYADDGQLLSGSLMDYLLPAAPEVPTPLTEHVCTPSPLNPLGVKGVGESATIPVPACINNAVADALGVAANESPLSPSRVRSLVSPPGPAVLARPMPKA